MTEQEFEWFVARRAEDLATIQRTERERDEARAAVLKLRDTVRDLCEQWHREEGFGEFDMSEWKDLEAFIDTESYEQYR